MIETTPAESTAPNPTTTPPPASQTAKAASALTPAPTPAEQLLAKIEQQLAKEFLVYDGEAPDELPSLIENFLPEGVIFFGSVAGTIKTWLGISISKALITGKPLWGKFKIPDKVAVLYLIPEASDGTFKRRLKKMRFPANDPRFRYRTISQGAAPGLGDTSNSSSRGGTTTKDENAV